jgi:hypothetical protein
MTVVGLVLATWTITSVASTLMQGVTTAFDQEDKSDPELFHVTAAAGHAHGRLSGHGNSPLLQFVLYDRELAAQRFRPRVGNVSSGTP